MNRKEAKILGHETFRRLKPCIDDGCHVFYTATGKCTECVRYVKAIQSGHIDGIRGNGNDKTIKDKWCDEMADIHSQSVKRALVNKFTPEEINLHHQWKEFRKAALEKHERFYIGKPCITHGVTKRLASNDCCYKCRKIVELRFKQKQEAEK